MQKNNKNLWIGLIVVLIILAGLLFWSMNKGAVSGTSQNGGQGATEDTSAPSINAGITSTISYESALSKYQGAILALDESCKATPSNMTLKNNSTLLVDNRSSLDRVVKVGSTIMNLRANSFKLVQVADASSSTLSVDCDQSKNVAGLSIQ